MAVELCPENAIFSRSGSNSRGMSPRISFSHDFIQIDGIVHGSPIPIEPYNPLHQSSLFDQGLAAASSVPSDFDFCIRKSNCKDQESSSADELFSNGVIRPLPSIQSNFTSKNEHSIFQPSHAASHVSNSFSSTSSSSSQLPPLPPHAPIAAPEDEVSKEDVKSNQEDIEEEHEVPQQSTNSNSSKKFWGFKRSRSLNCGSLYKRGLCPLPLLSRSKSTGSTSSASSSKKSLITSNNKEGHHQSRNQRKENNHSKKESNACSNHNSSSVSGFKFSQPFSASTMNMNGTNQHHQKPPLNKYYNQGSAGTNGGGTNNNGSVSVNPILNVPSGNVFGFGSIFSIGKNNKKTTKKKCLN